MNQIPVYAKFMKEILSGKWHLRDDENVILVEECSDVIERKISPKLTDPSRFAIPCSIGPVKVDQDLYDLGDSINLMSILMMKRLGYGEPKSNHMTLTLADCYVMYPYGILGMCKAARPYIIQKIYNDRSVEVKDLGDSKVFKVKIKELMAFPTTNKALEMKILKGTRSNNLALARYSSNVGALIPGVGML
ncbi:uncharacterized protein LOC127131700 [Lathyrus oleraceus]|uniref:uncharacterized protein LOC127131700 n=1 Tax=Pisum sativum TaxID=3888 RepID=UPI0021D26D22|nr:uncharacterized protein LOC127131700 [Pisum sativum]